MKNNTNKELKKQNEKIEFVKDWTLVIGIDVGSEFHYARAITNRKIELSKKPFKFYNNEEGFKSFINWAKQIAIANKKTLFLVGMEATGHYWFNLASYLDAHDMLVCHVNTAAVKKSKELDDNSQLKSDRKDPKVIAELVTDGRYSLPYRPTGEYASLRHLNTLMVRNQEELTRVKNRYARWVKIYFPELTQVYGKLNASTAMIIMKEAPLPQDIVKLGIEGIVKMWREHKIRAVGEGRAKKLYDAAVESIGQKEAPETARLEYKQLTEELNLYQSRVDELEIQITEELMKVPNVEKILNIKGLGVKTVASFIAEIGDISRFDDPKQIQKLAGLSIVECSSGKHQGEHHISYRGRKLLRYTIYKLALTSLEHNDDMKQLHAYYTTRQINPLKKMQSVIAIGCKLIRIIFKILKDGVEYDGTKMLADIKRPTECCVA